MELDAIRLMWLQTILLEFIYEYENDSMYADEVALARELANTSCGWIKAWFDEAAF